MRVLILKLELYCWTKIKNELDCNSGNINNKYLLASVYYIISGASDKIAEGTGKIMTTIKGVSDFNTPDVDMETHNQGFTFADSQNTNDFYNQYTGNLLSNAVYYNLKLTSAMTLLISTKSDDLPSTRVTIYNKATRGMITQKDFNKQSASKYQISMQPGEYILTTDGKIRNGTISLNVEGVKPSTLYDYSISLSSGYSYQNKSIIHLI